MDVDYDALIRTFNSEKLLPLTIESLEAQRIPPKRFIFVDSGSMDGTLREIPVNSIVHHYLGTAFNYSDAINQGVPLASSECILIISSHTTIAHPGALVYALELLHSNTHFGAAYFADQGGTLSHTTIDAESFDGFNGLWNTCAVIRTELLLERPFRPEVFSAEDQEWANWLINCRGLAVARIIGAGVSNDGNVRTRGQLRRKRTNEYVAIAYFIRPELRSARNIISLSFQSLLPFRKTFAERLFLGGLAYRLFGTWIKEPRTRSRYF
jgi:glycosyltransferase involved in cell wall biosynthesis